MSERWLLGLPSVGSQPGDKIDDKIGWAPVAGVFNLRDILELGNDGLNDETMPSSSFARPRNWTSTPRQW